MKALSGGMNAPTKQNPGNADLRPGAGMGERLRRGAFAFLTILGWR